MHVDIDNIESVSQWLASQELDNTVKRLDSPGEGNMNQVRRATTTAGSLIVKQAVPWVAKYPDIPAPIERASVEADFYRAVRDSPVLSRHMPRLLTFDAQQHMLAFEDLGDAADFTFLYQRRSSDLDTFATRYLPGLCNWLGSLHRLPIEAEEWPSLQNRAMRQLNFAHIFEIPLTANNGLNLDDITPGLDALASQLQGDSELRTATTSLGRTYLADGNSLLHGDCYPGSWLTHKTHGVAIIDPEFGFLGAPEFDVGVFAGHLILAGATQEQAQDLLKHYKAADGFSWPIALGFAGVEIIRRLIGVAQLPLQIDLEEKRALLQAARALAVRSQT